MRQRTKRCIEEFIALHGETALIQMLATKLDEQSDAYTLTIVCNRGAHAIPDSMVRGEEFTLSEGRSVDTSTNQGMNRSVTEILTRLARKLKEKNWKKIYMIPSGHPLLYAHAKLMVFQITRIETTDVVYLGNGEYEELYVSHRTLATTA